MEQTNKRGGGGTQPARTDPTSLQWKAQRSGQRTGMSPGQERYYHDGEAAMDSQWDAIIWPFIHKASFDCALDLAAGYGRNSRKLLEVCDELIIVEINRDCVAHCQARFADRDNIRYCCTDGCSLADVPDATVSLVYSWDSMVHFDPDVIHAYLHEFARVCRPGGHCFCHHSNYDQDPTGDLDVSPHRRNHMSAALFAAYARDAGLTVVKQQLLDWGGYAELDCLTLLQK